MEIDKSWNAIRAIWEDPAGRDSHSYGPALATPPLSPLYPPKQEIRNGVESDKDSHEPCTPSSDTFDPPRTETHKGVHPIAKITSMDLFTALNSPWPSPLFSGRITPSYHKPQRSRSTDFDDTRISSTNYFDRKTDETYQEMGQAICIRIRRILHRRSESRLALSISDEKDQKYGPELMERRSVRTQLQRQRLYQRQGTSTPTADSASLYSSSPCTLTTWTLHITLQSPSSQGAITKRTWRAHEHQPRSPALRLPSGKQPFRLSRLGGGRTRVRRIRTGDG
jgi:hypothetical protein